MGCFRKIELRELKLLQKQEQKQFQDLAFKAQFMKEQQEKKFESDMQVTFIVYDAANLLPFTVLVCFELLWEVLVVKLADVT